MDIENLKQVQPNRVNRIKLDWFFPEKFTNI